MIVTQKPLLTVKVLTKKLADQIQYVEFDWKEGALHRRIWTALHDKDAAVYGWRVRNESSKLRFWLVKFEGQLFWYCPPDSGPVFDLHSPKLEQLFVG